ncbi:MAG TPA: 50S ribosomal protein L32 [Bacillota bacterium]|jgi:large subunit ribosomal protein L32|nr:50S ribosomal protein L32 [Bacillota bacterium]HOB86208.1 50S ribosomal protein L32 [Bacillota bacterium]HOP68770.1 50S ribosomal protein L32 [Bacillota bacterium]HPT33863.1 50S ribosomal protein L32 [Bacillota bacterium]HPZ64582.1 50S ribosomal protein L32 [Bacillota bacterium]
MAVPKRRTSRARRDRRRAHRKIEVPHLVPCPQCHELKPIHRVCLNCGTYKNREVVKVD